MFKGILVYAVVTGAVGYSALSSALSSLGL